MTFDAEALRAWVNAGSSAAAEDLQAQCDEAVALVTKYVTDFCTSTDPVTGDPVAPPDEIVARAVIEVAADLWHRRRAPNGILNQQFAQGGNADFGALPIRISRDPLAPARPILAGWNTMLGFA